jgi:PQQ-dependent catabolism-associated CXXCW motif protein
MKVLSAAALTLALTLTTIPVNDTSWAGVLEPETYRLENYRSPVPETLKGAKVIGLKEAERLWRNKAAIFVDVLPRPPKPKLPEGTVYRPKPHDTIPGAIWLADVGYGALTPEMEDYFQRNLQNLTGGDKAKPVVIFCLSNCWMSWNAGKRAVSWGYSNILWFPDGADRWSEAGLPLNRIEPLPRPGETQSQ